MLRSLPLAILLCAAGCFSPAQDEEIASLGDEVPGIPEGPFHRYGQNCLACHGGYGPGAPEFFIGGTVFATPTDDIPVANARVTVTDAAGTSLPVYSNCAGNFWFETAGFPGVFPVRVEVECPLPPDVTLPPDGTRTLRNVMGTRINRDGGCASCHAKGPATADAPAQVYCAKVQPDPPFEIPAPCDGGPLGGSQ